MESQPQNPEFRSNPENFHPWIYNIHNIPLNLLHFAFDSNSYHASAQFYKFEGKFQHGTFISYYLPTQICESVMKA